MRRPHDAAARDLIASDRSSSMAVDAAAGSGKTTSLVGRIVSLVREGSISMKSIAAITFTEAAAAELRGRVREVLSKEGAADPRLMAASFEVDEAAISTIHSFARRILGEHWIEAGLPPAVEVLDGPSELIDRRERWQTFLSDLLAEPSAGPVLTRAFALGLRLSQLNGVANCFAENHNRIEPKVLGALNARRQMTANPAVSIEPLKQAIEGALDHLQACAEPDNDHLFAHLCDRLMPSLEILKSLDPADETTVLSVLEDLPSLGPRNLGKNQNWNCDVSTVRQACADANEVLETILFEVRQSVINDLVWRIASWAVDCATARRDEGRLTFQDLLVECHRLLRDDPEVRSAAADRYKYLLVDEFQDTDPLQVELIRLLTERRETGSADITTTNDPATRCQEPPRLFVVGDPEQSIYRFRGADISLFNSVVAEIEPRVELTTNFRSVPGVLRWVDEAIGPLVGETAGEEPRDGSAPEEVPGGGGGHRRLVPFREALEGAPLPVTLYGSPHPAPADDVRELAAVETAKMVRHVIDDRWAVSGSTDPLSIEARPARYGDVAVLLPTRTSLDALEHALEQARVPYRLEGASLVWAAQEVRDLIAVLRAVEDPADPIAVVGALRTPALACGDDDLVRFKEASGSWDPRAPVPPSLGTGDPVPRAMGLLAKLHSQRMWMEPSALISAMLDELHFMELALVHDRPRDHWQRLRWTLDQARAFDETNQGTLGDFLEWVERQEDEGGTGTLGPPEPDDDAVRILTIHGAKGLEFPVVVLTGLEGFDHSRITPGVLWAEDGVPEIRFVGKFQTPGYEPISLRERALDRDERRRLLYVAATRARDHLLVDLNQKEERGTQLVSDLRATCEAAPHTWRTIENLDPSEIETAPIGPGLHTVLADLPGPEEWWREHQEWTAKRSAVIATGTRQPAWSATALAQASRIDPDRPTSIGFARHEIENRIPRPSSGEHGERRDDQKFIGRAVHDVMAKIDLGRAVEELFNHPGRLPPFCLEVVRAAIGSHKLEHQTAREVEIITLNALEAPTVQSIARHRYFQELALAAPVIATGDGSPLGVLDGAADLVGMIDSGLVVLDFKTVRDMRDVDPHDPGVTRYLYQVAAYAYALRSATGLEVSKVVIFYLSEHGFAEATLEGTGLEDAIQTVLETAESWNPTAIPSR